MPRSAVVGWFVGRLTRLRFPVLFLFSAVLFAIDLVVPDFIPFADEVLLGLATALLASWRKRRVGAGEPSSKT
jgi:hypothetical protein